MRRLIPWMLLFAGACGRAGEMRISQHLVLAERPDAPPTRARARTAPARGPANAVVTVSRRTVREVLAAGPQRFMSRILLDPFFLERRFVGFQLTRFYEGDPRFAGVDLRRNDVVMRVNGLPIGRPEQFMRAWEELRSSDELRIEYLRGAEKRLLRIVIEDHSPRRQ